MTTRYGPTTYAGTYRIAYEKEERFLEVKRSTGTGYSRVAEPIPHWIRGAYAAAAYFKV